ncbi:hypothetical protein POL68_13560 [Stigmatella sp. ncwal1]|uniref:Uncharacterized protein n=1 Tax=Stigmatella ashevillensis TaxID=2995309 RepID=A0ABT5D764_9BACT|nr:hypothetical protein [Stigmatella ashevillena]MDC0709492.1 hypothetical protein [Stigmatella ashevillena]
MSLFIHIFCQADKPLRAREITHFIEEGAYFGNPPKVTVSPPSQPDDAQWTELKIEYQARKRPVLLHREARAAEFKDDQDEAIEALQSAGLAKKHEALISRLKDAQQLIVFELDSEKVTEECWEMVDNMEAWIAQELKGLIYVTGEGFYDAELKPLCKLAS